jgi:hypothetical protein
MRLDFGRPHFRVAHSQGVDNVLPGRQPPSTQGGMNPRPFAFRRFGHGASASARRERVAAARCGTGFSGISLAAGS